MINYNREVKVCTIHGRLEQKDIGLYGNDRAARCLICRRAQNKVYRIKNKEKLNKLNKLYRLNNKCKAREIANRYIKRIVDELRDCYMIMLLSDLGLPIDNSMIQLKRSQIKLRRKIKEIKNGNSEKIKQPER